MAVIYGLVHGESKRVYVGCTKGKVAKRLREHRCLLRAGKHAEPELQRDWTAYGEQSFTMEVLEEIGDPLAERRTSEKRWMEHFKELGLLYNRNLCSFEVSPEAMAKGIEASRHVSGNRWTAEANEKRRLAQLGKPKGQGAKISATKRARREARQAKEIV
jgi:group I intron endonuclease